MFRRYASRDNDSRYGNRFLCRLVYRVTLCGLRHGNIFISSGLDNRWFFVIYCHRESGLPLFGPRFSILATLPYLGFAGFEASPPQLPVVQFFSARAQREILTVLQPTHRALRFWKRRVYANLSNCVACYNRIINIFISLCLIFFTGFDIDQNTTSMFTLRDILFVHRAVTTT